MNGPAIAATGRNVGVAWFTAAADKPSVKIAFSTDAGAVFGQPFVVDDQRPLGRVDIVLLDDASALVSWLQQVGGSARVRVRDHPQRRGGRVEHRGGVQRSPLQRLPADGPCG